jgi:hypothetical protein
MNLIAVDTRRSLIAAVGAPLLLVVVFWRMRPYHKFSKSSLSRLMPRGVVLHAVDAESGKSPIIDAHHNSVLLRPIETRKTV